jgi:hypothetical protein
MFSFMIAGTAFLFIFVGVGVGWVIKRFLPANQVPDSCKEIVKTAAGLMATLVALVIGLLVSSAKSSYDMTNNGITQLGAKSIILDRMMMRMGPDAQPLRVAMVHALEGAMEKIWPSERGKAPDMEAIEKDKDGGEVYERIMALEPKNDVQKHFKEQAVKVMGEILQSRWHIIEQNQNILPPMLIAMLILWLTILYLFFSMLAPHNGIAMFSLAFSALSVSTALFIILELNRPFQGVVRVSKAPLEKALQIMKRN